MKKVVFFVLPMLLLGVFVMPHVSRAETDADTLSGLRAQLEMLLKQVNELTSKIKHVEKDSGQWCHTFSKNLRIGDTGWEVAQLQTALSQSGFKFVATDRDDSIVFDEQTASLVVGFQEKYKGEVLGPHKLTRGTGYAGHTTRAKLNKLYGCKKEHLDDAVPVPQTGPIVSYVQAKEGDKNALYPGTLTFIYGKYGGFINLDKEMYVELSRKGEHERIPVTYKNATTMKFITPDIGDGEYELFLSQGDLRSNKVVVEVVGDEIHDVALDYVQVKEGYKDVLYPGRVMFVHGENLNSDDLYVYLMEVGGEKDPEKVKTYSQAFSTAKFTAPDMESGDYYLYLKDFDSGERSEKIVVEVK